MPVPSREAALFDGHIVMLFVIALAASEACIGLALVIVLIRQRDVLDSDKLVDFGGTATCGDLLREAAL